MEPQSQDTKPDSKNDTILLRPVETKNEVQKRIFSGVIGFCINRLIGS